MAMVEQFVRGWLETYNTADLDGAMSRYTDDVEFEDPIFGERVSGKAALRTAFSQFFFTTWKVSRETSSHW
jgi:ketosteroid isomerase-like protein